MIDVIVSGGLNLTVEDTGDIINVVVEVAAPMVVEVVVGIPTKENIVGLAKNDSPEFSDVVIPEIAAESSYTPSAWSWLTGLFGAVTGSVKAMLVGLVERVSIIDNITANNIIYDVTLTEDVEQLSFDFNSEKAIEICVSAQNNTDSAALAVIKINNISSNSYVTTTTRFSGFISYVGRYKVEGIYRFKRMPDGNIFIESNIQHIWGTSSVQNIASRNVIGYLEVPQSGINNISFSHNFMAGSRIVVKRIG